MPTTIERTEVAHATVPGQRAGADTPDRFTAELSDALSRLRPALAPTTESRERARQRIAALLAS